MDLVAEANFWETNRAMWEDLLHINSLVLSCSSGLSTRTCFGCKTRIECNLAIPSLPTLKLNRPRISAVVAVALLSSRLAPLPNSFSTLRVKGPRAKLVRTVVWSTIRLTVTSPSLLMDDSPYNVAFGLGVFLEVLFVLLFWGFLLVALPCSSALRFKSLDCRKLRLIRTISMDLGDWFPVGCFLFFTRFFFVEAVANFTLTGS